MSIFVEDEVPAAGKHSIDPDEPWRYACPDCGSVSVRPRASNRISGKSYTAGGYGRATADRDRYMHYQCMVCHSFHENIVDLKEERFDDPLDR